MNRLRLPFLCTLALGLAVVLAAATPARAASVSLPPALAGFPYKGCLSDAPLPGTSVRAEDGNNLNSYVANGQPSNMTMGFQSNSYWCLVGETLGYNNFSFTVQAYPWGTNGDGVGTTPLETYNVSISALLPKFILEGPSQGQVGTPFTTHAQAYTDPSSSLGWTASVAGGSLPPGLSLSGNGDITGTPTQAGTYSFTLEYTTTAVPWQTSARPRNGFTLTIGGSGGATPPPTPPATPPTPPATPPAAGPMTIQSSTPGPGVAYQPYTISWSVARGVSPVTFSVTAGALPPGLRLVAGGITGRPTKAGTYEFTVTAVDSRQVTATRTYTVTIQWPHLTLSPAVLAPAKIGKAYRARLYVGVGRKPFTFTLKKGSKLPPGLKLSADGLISGRVAGPAKTYRVRIAFSDVNGAPGEDVVVLRVAKAPTRRR